MVLNTCIAILLVWREPYKPELPKYFSIVIYFLKNKYLWIQSSQSAVFARDTVKSPKHEHPLLSHRECIPSLGFGCCRTGMLNSLYTKAKVEQIRAKNLGFIQTSEWLESNLPIYFELELICS